MSHPRFSIVVPTRHRPHTLPHTLATILAQDHDSYEIIVADNASGAETRQVVEALACPQLRYLRSDTPLPMAANWERALAAARGEWITFIGDDDGLMPDALPRCDAIIAAHDVQSIAQQYAVYVWPCAGSTGEADRLQVHLGKRLRIEDSQPSLARMAVTPGAMLVPNPYHGWIRRSLYERVAASGPVFQGQDPDTLAGIMLAAVSDRFVWHDRPLSLVGISGTSNTFRSFVADSPGALQQDRDTLNAAAGLVRHPLVPDVPVTAAVILDGLLKAGDRLGPAISVPRLDPLTIARNCLAGVWRTDDVGRSQIAAIRGTLSRPEDLEAFAAAVEATKPSGRPPRMVCIDRGRRGPYLVLDTRPLGVRTIAGAATAAAAALETASLAAVEPHPLPPPLSTVAPPRPHLLKRLERDVRRTVRGWWRSTAARADSRT